MQIPGDWGLEQLHQPVMSRKGSDCFSYYRLWSPGGLHRPHRHSARLQPQESSGRKGSGMHSKYQFIERRFSTLSSKPCAPISVLLCMAPMSVTKLSNYSVFCSYCSDEPPQSSNWMVLVDSFATSLFLFDLFQTEEFISLTDGERTAMKWKFLLERCKIYVKVP